MDVEEPQVCKSCGASMDRWEWVRFAGIGPWKGKNDLWSCKSCGLRYDGSKVPEIKTTSTGPTFIFKSSKYGGQNMSEGAAKRIRSRVIDKDGKTLSGREGIRYMEKHADVYAPRLKEYYSI